MTLSNDQITILLSCPTADAQRDWLTEAGLFSAEGFESLLPIVRRLMEQNVSQAGELALLIAAFASEVSAESLRPQAIYLAAQSDAILGNLDQAQHKIEQSRAAFLAIGLPLLAWRTTLGLLRVLAEKGDLQGAIQEGTNALTELASDVSTESNHLQALIRLNMGLCAYFSGDYSGALQYYAQTDETALLVDEKGMLTGNRSLALIASGRFREALELAESTIDLFSADSHPQWQARQYKNLGYIRRMMGDFIGALNAFESARDRYASLEDQPEAAVVWLDSAENWLALNMLSPAEDGFNRAIEGLVGRPWDQARAHAGLAAIQQQRGNFESAETSLQAALLVSEKQENPDLIATLLTEYSGLQLRTERAIEAGISAEKARSLAVSPSVRFFATLRHCDFAIQQNNAVLVAETIAEAAEQSVADLPNLAHALEKRRGLWANLQGDSAAAEQHFLKAIEAIEQVRSSLTSDALRSSFLEDKTNVYAELISLYLAQEDVDSLQNAFITAERAKARSLVDLMLGNLDARLARSHPPETRQQIKQLRAELNALYNQIVESDQSDRGVSYLQSRVTQLESELRLLREQRGGFDSSAVREAILQNPLVAATRQLPSGVPLVAYHMLNNELLAFVVLDGVIHVERKLSQPNAVAALTYKLQTHWSHLKLGRNFTDRHLQRLNKTGQRILNQLYTLIFKPLEAYLPQTGPLVVVPTAHLHSLPFHALFDGHCYLNNRYTFSYAPTVSIFSLCQDQAPSQFKSPFLMGVAEAGLAHVSDEISAIAVAVDAPSVYLNHAASIENLRTHGQRSDFLHIASHGLFRPINPRFSALQLADGWLTVDDILHSMQVPPHVTLSACDSGRLQFSASDEPMGLACAFLAAGANSLLVTLWPVQDDIAAAMMPGWYQLKKSGWDSAEALRHMQQEIQKEYPHPYYWAPFVLLGQRAFENQQGMKNV